MTIVVHPAAVNAGARGWVCDNHLVTNTGASACLHKTEQKIFAV